ncbi:hypothetical protein OOU_Y34scaffold00666g150 [Pyricularia oryzae Y34]|uniref:Uncharacterized protein n=4 Tax=Pyricularia oryzae TaxID=318829 RepID=Q2KGE8_PYRO7|nr:hypothetical protein MGCH7_ch7g387 [Pyricularia oryzae 70-15]ELQ36289.1 hypothetical protein OOU_Y34scaffold00666g150 [Pyricularia oryzae Y34]QBZ66129.1 hypothetical protein PoMZ_13100 [Pyricularia oryzae]
MPALQGCEAREEWSIRQRAWSWNAPASNGRHLRSSGMGIDRAMYVR